MPDEHWTEGFEHASITDENREAFNTHMAKFPTQEDAVADGFGLAKLKGKPFKMPESLAKLPDDASRGDFTAQAHKLLGIEHAKDIEGLADLNMKAGQVDGAPFDENLANAFKTFVVEKRINKTSAQDIVEFHNQTMGKANQALVAKTEADKLAAAKSTNEALIAHPDFGSEEEVVKQSELLKRAIQNHVGLTPEEVEEFADTLADSMLTRNPVMARVMLKVLAPLAATADIEGGGKGKPPEPTKDPDEGSKTYKALGWSK